MRRYMNLVEDVWRNHVAADPQHIRMTSEMKHLTTIDGIGIHAWKAPGGHGFHIVFVKEPPVTEFFTAPEPQGPDDPRRVGECFLEFRDTIDGQRFYEFGNINLHSSLRGKGFGYKFYNWVLDGVGLTTAHVLTPFSFAVWKKLAADPSVATWYYDDEGNPRELSEILSDERDHYPPFFASKKIRPKRRTMQVLRPGGIDDAA